MHDRRVARSVRTRRRLLRGARRLFTTRGYDATPAELVAAHAGITRAALYYHFADKRALFRSVCEQMEAECVAGIVHAAGQVSDFGDQVAAAARATLDAFLDPAYVQVVFRDAPAVLGWEGWQEIVGRFGRNQLRVGLEAAIVEGRIPQQPPAALARVITGAINEAGLAIAQADDPTRARAEYGAVIDALLEGLLRPHTASP